MGWEKNDRLGTMHTSSPLTIADQFGIKIGGFTPSFELLGRLEEEEEDDDDENSDFA